MYHSNCSLFSISLLSVFILLSFTIVLSDQKAFAGTDLIPPTGTIEYNSGAAYANTGLSLTLSCSDGSGSGCNTAILQIIDSDFNLDSDDQDTLSAQVTFTSNPTDYGATFVETGDDTAIFQLSIDLTPGAYTFTNDDIITVVYTAIGEGTKTAQVTFFDVDGTGSTLESDSIIVDTTSPTGTVLINADAPSTDVNGVTLTLSCDDTLGSGCATMEISTDGGLNYGSPITNAPSAPATLPAPRGDKTVVVRFTDAVGNVSVDPQADDTIALDAKITIFSAPSNPTPRWGLDSVDFTGTVTNALNSDQITIDGDSPSSATSTTVDIDDGQSGDFIGSIIYPAGSFVGNDHQPTATLVTDLGDPVTSAPQVNSPGTVEVVKHDTALTAPSAPADSKWSFTFTASSTLTDLDAAGAAISGKAISFSGTGVAGSSSSTPTDLAGIGTSTTVQASGIGTTGLKDIQADFAAGDPDYNPVTSLTSPITILAHDTTLALDAIADRKWGFAISSITGKLADADYLAAGLLGDGVDAKSITLGGSGIGTVPTSASTIPDGTFATLSGRAPLIPAGLKSVTADFAADADYNAPTQATTGYTTLPHDTALELDFIPDPIQGTFFNGKGNSLTDLDFAAAGLDTAGISTKPITFDDAAGGSSPLALATTGGITFAGSGLEILSCPTCSPNPGSTDPITQALKVSTGATITLPPGNSVVSVTVQNSDNNLFTLTGTNVEGNTCSENAEDSSPNITTLNLDCGGPAISQIVFTSVGGTGTLKVTQVKTFKPSTVDSNLISANFEDEPLGIASSVTVADGAYHSTALAQLPLTTSPISVQSHFAGDTDYIASDSNIREYNTQLSNGVGGTVTAIENYVKSFTAQACAAGDDDDGDALCDGWETSGVSYTANGNSYTYIIPGANVNKKNINVELDAMSGFAPSMAASGPIDRVITSFASAPVTNPGGQSNGIILTVDDDDVSLAPVASMNVWVDFDSDPNNDFGTIKGRFFGTTAERPLLGGTQVDVPPAGGSALSFTTTISGVTISPPGDTTRWTEGTIFFKQRVTLGTGTLGAVTAAKTATDVGSNLIFGTPTVEVITPDTLQPLIKILLVKQPFKMAPAFTTTGNNVGTITLTIPTTASTTLTLTTPPIPPTLTTTLLNAKAQTTHYALFADSIGSCGPSGIGEANGNDFVVSLGCGFTEPVGSADQISGTFMHELGHNLGLAHGGPSVIQGVNVQDSTQNCKPIYTSVMSYSRQLPTFFASSADFKVDYSRGYFATPGPSLLEQQLFENLGFKANTAVAADIPKIIFGTPGQSSSTRSVTGITALANLAPRGLLDGDGIVESLGGTHTTTVSDGSVGSGNTGTFTLTNIKASTSTTAAAGEVKIRTILDFTAIDPGAVTVSATASPLNSFVISGGYPTATISGIGDTRIVDVTLRFTRAAGSAVTDASIADVTVTISGATATATMTASEGPLQVDIAYTTASASSKTGKVRGPEITTSTSGSITLKQKITLGTSARLEVSALTQAGAGSASGLTWGTPTISSLTPGGLASATNANINHIITITQPYTATAAVSSISMGELTYTITTKTSGGAAQVTTTTTMIVEPNSPSIVQMDLNNFGITGCTASTNNVAYQDYNDWINLKYDFRGAAGNLLNARQGDFEPNGNNVIEATNEKNKYGGVLPPLNQNIEGAGDMSRVKTKQTVPIKFILKDDNGAIVTNAQIKLVAKGGLGSCGPDTVDEQLPTVESTSGTLFVFTGGQYHYNWKIPSNWPVGKTGLNFEVISNPGGVLTHFDTGFQHGDYSLFVCVRK